MNRYFMIILIALISLVVLSGCITNTQDEKIVKIGYVGPLSGDVGAYGMADKAAIELAIEDLNSIINGREVQLIVEDGKCDGKAASEAFNKLINVDKVDFIIGGLCSSETLAGATLTNQAKIIQITNGSSSPAIRSAGDYTFGLYPLDDFEGKYLAEQVYQRGFRNVAILSCLSDWCKGEETVFKSRFEELGGKIVIIERNEKDAIDIKTQLVKIAEANPDFIFAPQYNTVQLLVMSQIKEQDINVQLIFPQLLDADTIKKANGAAEGIWTDSLVNSDTSIIAARIKDKLDIENYDLSFSALAYDAVTTLNLAVKGANSWDKEAIKNAMYNVEFDGVSGYHKFDKDGVPASANYVIKVVVNGELVDLE